MHRAPDNIKQLRWVQRSTRGIQLSARGCCPWDTGVDMAMVVMQNHPAAALMAAEPIARPRLDRFDRDGDTRNAGGRGRDAMPPRNAAGRAPAAQRPPAKQVCSAVSAVPAPSLLGNSSLHIPRRPLGLAGIAVSPLDAKACAMAVIRPADGIVCQQSK